MRIYIQIYIWILYLLFCLFTLERSLFIIFYSFTVLYFWEIIRITYIMVFTNIMLVCGQNLRQRFLFKIDLFCMIFCKTHTIILSRAQKFIWRSRTRSRPALDFIWRTNTFVHLLRNRYFILEIIFVYPLLLIFN